MRRNCYRRLSDLCDELALVLLGKHSFDIKVYFSDNNRRLEVYWQNNKEWNDLSFEEKSNVICEAHTQAFFSDGYYHKDHDDLIYASALDIEPVDVNIDL